MRTEGRRLPPRAREIALAAAALVVLAAAAFGRHVAHGGFSADDWAFAENVRHPSPAGVFADAQNVTGARPVYGLYLGLILAHVGASAAGWLAIALAVGVVAALMFFIALRSFGLPGVHAGVLAALVLMFPLSDATILWFSASTGILSAAFYLAGLGLTVRSLRRSAPLWSPAHLAGAALYALSIMSNEITAPLIVASGLLYLLVAGRGAVLRRAVLDAVVAGLVVGLVSYPQTPKALHSGIGFLAAHVRLIVLEGTQQVGWGLFPFKYLAQTPEIVAVLAGGAVLLALGAWVARIRPELRPALRRSLVCAGAGLLVTFAGWVILIPGALGYSPGAGGNGNRINVAAGLGIVLLVYAGVTAAATLIAGFLAGRGRALRVGPLSAVGLIVVGVGYLYRLEHDIDVRDRAASEQSALLRAMHRALPTIPSGGTVFVAGYQPETYTDIPVFELPFDLVNAVRYEWRDAGISAWPVVGSVSLGCGAGEASARSGGVALAGEQAPYGRAYLFRFRPRLTMRITGPAACSVAAQGAG